MGDMASPGSEAMADTDQIASRTTSDTEPFPVLIFMAWDFSIPPRNSYTKQNGPAVRPARRLGFFISLRYSAFTQRTGMPLARA